MGRKGEKIGKSRSSWAFLSLQSRLSPTRGSSIYCDKPSLDKICRVQLHCMALGAHVFPTDCEQRHLKGESQHWGLLDLCAWAHWHEGLVSGGSWQPRGGTAPLCHLCLLQAMGQQQLPGCQMGSSFQESTSTDTHSVLHLSAPTGHLNKPFFLKK